MDAQFGFEVGRHKNSDVNYKTPFDDVENVTWDPSAPTTCIYKYRKNKWNFYWDTPGPLPAHLEKEIFQEFSAKPSGYGDNSLYDKQPANNGLWNGPYVVSEVKHGSHVILDANPNYSGRAAKIKRIIIKFIPNTSTLRAHLVSKDIDMISRIGMSADEALAFDKQVLAEKLPYKIIYKDSFAYVRIQMNMDHPILKDIRVRTALLYGFNEKALDVIFDGKIVRAFHFLSPQDPNYTDKFKLEAPKQKRNQLAKELLSKAGWVLAKDGFRYKQGRKLSLTLVTLTGAATYGTIQALAQADWKALGVDLQLKTETPRQLYSETFSKRNFDLCLYSNYLLPGDPPEEQLHSKYIPNEKNNRSGENIGGFSSPEVDHLFLKLHDESNSQKRKKIIQKIVKEYVDLVPAIPLYFKFDATILPQSFKNYVPTGSFFYESLDAEKWDY